MSKEAAKDLIAELNRDQELKAKVQGITDIDELVRIAKASGYDITAEELEEAERAYKRARSAETDEKLGFDDLEDVAGGFHGFGDEAPDGHEMGCDISYHWDGYSKENNVWCSNSFYCTSEAHECVSSDKYCVGATKVQRTGNGII